LEKIEFSPQQFPKPPTLQEDNPTHLSSKHPSKMADRKRYHIYVKAVDAAEEKQFSCHTLEEARALIMYERDETDTDNDPAHTAMYTVFWGDYAKQFSWIVKDTHTHLIYNYNPATRTLIMNLL
jgi:hypothetical protein